MAAYERFDIGTEHWRYSGDASLDFFKKRAAPVASRGIILFVHGCSTHGFQLLPQSIFRR